MSSLDERTKADLIHEASSFLSKSLYRKDRFITFLMILSIALSGLFLVWLAKQYDIYRVWGVMVIILLLALFVIGMPTFVRRYYGKLVSRYENRFGSNPPLLVTLFTFKPDTPFNIHRLLRRWHLFVLQAFRKEGFSLNPDVMITLEYERDFGIFFSKNNFYGYINENIIARGADGIWATGEFGMLKDPRFIDDLEASEGGHTTLLGYVEGSPSNLDAFLKTLNKMAKEEGEPSNRQIDSNRQARIKRLVENKKLSICLTPVRIDEPHMAVLSDWIFIQQQHEHTADRPPIAAVLVKAPSGSLKRFVEDYLAEFSEHVKRI